MSIKNVFSGATALNGGQFRSSIKNRLLSVILDLLLSVTLYHTLLGTTSLGELLNFLGDFVKWPSLPLIYMTFFLQRLMITLFLGQSLMERVCSLYSEGGHLHQRLAGATRVFFGAITAPFFVFDLPLLFDRMSLKEYFSGAPFLFYRRGSLFIGILLVPFLLVLSFYSQFLSEKTPTESYQMNHIGNPNPLSPLIEGNSSSKLQLTLPKESEQIFMMIPYFLVTRELKRATTIPAPIFYHPDSKGDLLFSIKSSGRSIFEMVSAAKSLGPNTNPLDESEIPLRLKDALELVPSNYHRFLGGHGLFIRDELELKGAILKEIGPSFQNRFDLMPIGDLLFFTSTSSDEEGYTVTFSPISSERGTTFQVNYKNKNSDAYINFLQKYLVNARWGKPLATRIRATREEDFSPFMILDFYLDSKFDASERALFEDYIYHYYFDLARQAIMQKNDELLSLVKNSTERLLIVAEMKNEKENNFFSERYLNFMRAIITTIKGREYSYYGIKE